MQLTLEEQVNIMQDQLANFPSLLEKMQYMKQYFDSDPTFTKEARDIVRGEIAKALPR